MAGATTDGAIADGHTLCVSTESCTENSSAGSETKRLDLGGDVVARRREVPTRLDPRYCQADRRRLGREIRKILARDRKRRTEGWIRLHQFLHRRPSLT